MPRLAIEAHGVVQGVGMRPFVHRAAINRRLVGWVQNRRGAVAIEVQGDRESLSEFVEALEHDCPRPASIERIVVREVEERDERTFAIVDSVVDTALGPTIGPDLGICRECSAEMDDPADRRHRYPFTNCAGCGPRFTIVESPPYDRSRTSMKDFAMCEDCAREYSERCDRRFHAQPIACPTCGPRLWLLSPEGRRVASADEALQRAARAVAAGGILALQGIGGFQLVADATNEEAVQRLRARKHRESKPFAVMFSSLESIRRSCDVSAEEEHALTSPAAPILLLARGDAPLAEGVAPLNPRIGAMLPYSPLHRLLVAEVGRPIVCTSGNLSDEPMCVNEHEALDRLGTIADVFLVHDRGVVRPADDSVGRVGPQGLMLLRRARGYAPLALRLGEPTPVVLALGGHLKSTVALSIDGQAIVSQHLGDTSSVEGERLLARTADDLLAFYGARPEVIACDLHPDYASSLLAERLALSYGATLERVQHHHAHAAACIAEHRLAEPVLGVVWDGAGYGEDGTLWGGEFLLCEGSRATRVAHLRCFPLPGGERALREPSRAALGLLYEAVGAARAAVHAHAWFGADGSVLQTMVARSLNSPLTSSVGRLFDAIAALVGLRACNRHEAEAASALEFAAGTIDSEAPVDPYEIRLRTGCPAIADWEPLVRAVLDDWERGVSVARISARFHESLARLAEEVSVRVGAGSIVLTGGCFQNARLLARTHERLARRGFRVRVPRLYPPNDGGLSLGQILVASRRFRERGTSCA